MNLFRTTAAAFAAVACTVGLSGVAHADTAELAAADPASAYYDGTLIHLDEDWQGAGACVVDGTRPGVCYATEAELLAAHPELTGDATADGSTVSTELSSLEPEMSAMSTSCSSSLRLYRETSYLGSVLFLTGRYVYHNLSSYGFDNDASSYRVGACGASFFSGSSGSGSIYPGPTSAYSSSATMASGWNNVVSSVYIY